MAVLAPEFYSQTRFSGVQLGFHALPCNETEMLFVFPDHGGDGAQSCFTGGGLGQIVLKAGKRQWRSLYISVKAVVGKNRLVRVSCPMKCRHLSHRVLGGKRPDKAPKGHRTTQGQEGDAVVILEQLALHNPMLQVIW